MFRESETVCRDPKASMTAVARNIAKNLKAKMSRKNAAARSPTPPIVTRPGTNGRSALRNSSSSCQRRSRDRSSPFKTARSSAWGSSGRTDRSGGTGSATIFARVEAASFASCGGLPASRKYRVAETE